MNNSNTNPHYLKLAELSLQLAEVAPDALAELCEKAEATLSRYLKPLTKEEEVMATQMGIAPRQWQVNKARATAKEREVEGLTSEEKHIVQTMGLDPRAFIRLRTARDALKALPEEQLATLRARHGGTDLVAMHASARDEGWTR